MQQNHPRIELFLNHGIDYLQKYGKKTEGEYAGVLQILWNNFLDDVSKSKVLSYKQEGRAIKLMEDIFKKYHFTYLAKYPQEFEKVFYSVVGGIDISQSSLLKKYYKNVGEWFSWEISELGISPKHEKNILESLKHFGNNHVEKSILLDILQDVGDFSKIQKFVRAYQALMNHSFYIFEGKIFSRFSFEIFSNYIQHTGEELENKVDFFARILHGYECISEFVTWEKQEISQQRKFFLANFKEKEITITQDKLEKYFPYPLYDPEYISILRHSYDWYIRIIPEEIHKLSSVELWAGGLTFLHEIYNACGEKYLPKKYVQISFFQRNNFLQYKGKKYSYKISHPAEFAFDDLLTEYEHIDEHLFFPCLAPKKEHVLTSSWEKIRASRIHKKLKNTF